MIRQLDIGALAPYGFLNAYYDGLDGELPTPLKATPEKFTALVDSLTAALADQIWPQFDLETGSWQGRAKSMAVALTIEDLALGEQLAKYFTAPVNPKDAIPKTHQDFFLEEDGLVIDPYCTDVMHPYLPWAGSFFWYDRSMDREVCKRLSKDFDGPGVQESGGLDLALKIRMQRPRPYQVAMQLGYPAFKYQRAHTAATPSLVSGHALESLISGCYVFRQHRNGLLSDACVMDAWVQFMVDVGDRRVFAGVHYPSDSMASWFCALRAVKTFYGAEVEPVRSFLWNGISKKSRVFAEIERRATEDDASHYKPLLQWLVEEANS